MNAGPSSKIQNPDEPYLKCNSTELPLTPAGDLSYKLSPFECDGVVGTVARGSLFFQVVTRQSANSYSAGSMLPIYVHYKS